MKTFSLISFGLSAAACASAITNLVVIGDHKPDTSGSFNGIPVHWEADIIDLAIFFVGMFQLFMPRVCWWFKWGWRFADSEPSALWLFFERAGGAIIVGATLIAFYVINYVPIS